MYLSILFFFYSTDPRSMKMFVLDEADEMLSRGFKDQIYDVFRKMPSNIQASSRLIRMGIPLLYNYYNY